MIFFSLYDAINRVTSGKSFSGIIGGDIFFLKGEIIMSRSVYPK